MLVVIISQISFVKTGPTGLPGSRGPPGKDVSGAVTPKFTQINTETPGSEDFPLDSWTILKHQGKRQFCRCRRGAIVSYFLLILMKSLNI